MLTLTKRLQTVADLVPKGCSFADIGTDHAYLPVWLLQNGVISSAIAGDIRQGPLERARATARRYGCTDQMDFRLSDGLKALSPHEADCIAIAGMGGEAICAILSAAPWTKRGVRLILQPQTNLPQLRRWLTAEGYRICQERCLFEEGHWYSVFLVSGGQDDTVWTPGSALAGCPDRWYPQVQRPDYLRFLIDRTKRELSGLQKAAAPDQARIYHLEEAVQELSILMTELEKEDVQ
ncbi:MAG: SAM-dependent methyltransferase [Oscillospiraceae bacterium]|nr:SAM-dependent methyltransferase [Oscillospiraceae bacterium]